MEDDIMKVRETETYTESQDHHRHHVISFCYHNQINNSYHIICEFYPSRLVASYHFISVVKIKHT